MSLSASEFFLQYSETVLGLRALPCFAVSAPRLLIADIPWPDGLSQDEMFQKMMAAIGLGPKTYEVVEALPSEVSSFQEQTKGRDYILCFSKELAEAFQLLKDLNPRLAYEVVFAWGPRDLRQDPAKKRATWDELKQLQTKMSALQRN